MRTRLSMTVLIVLASASLHSAERAPDAAERAMSIHAGANQIGWSLRRDLPRAEGLIERRSAIALVIREKSVCQMSYVVHAAKDPLDWRECGWLNAETGERRSFVKKGDELVDSDGGRKALPSDTYPSLLVDQLVMLTATDGRCEVAFVELDANNGQGRAVTLVRVGEEKLELPGGATATCLRFDERIKESQIQSTWWISGGKAIAGEGGGLRSYVRASRNEAAQGAPEGCPNIDRLFVDEAAEPAKAP